MKAARRMKAFEESEKENMKPTRKEKKSAVMDDHVKSAVTRPRPLPSIVAADLNQKENQIAMQPACISPLSAESVAWPGLRVLTEKRPHTLMPLAGANDGG